MTYTSWSLEIAIVLEQKQVLGIVDSTETALDVKDRTEFDPWKMQHGITWLTIALALEPSLHSQYGIQKDAKALWELFEEDDKAKAKRNVLA